MDTYADLPASYTGVVGDGYILTNGDLYIWKGTLNVDYLLVGGGGGASGGVSGVNFGAGGAGGILRAGIVTPAGGISYTVTVGAGGTANTTTPGNGGTSSIVVGGTTYAATGGNAVSSSGRTGGSNADYAGGSASGTYGAGGGAGAGGAGTANNSGGPGDSSSISGTLTYYGGGGADGSGSGTGGIGGGGNTGVNGTTNLGGGAGGTSSGGSQSGGSGIVILRYIDTYANSTSTGTLTTSSGYKIYTFTSSGSITFPSGQGWVLVGNTKGYTGSAGAYAAIGYTGSAGSGYTGSVGGLGYTGSAGAGYTGSSGTEAVVYIGTTAPTSPIAGKFWYKSDEATLYVYYNDGDTSQWVGITATGGNGSGGSLIPFNLQSGSYTLQASDNSSMVSITTGGITVPSGVFTIGMTVTILNNSSSNQTITQGASVTMYLSGMLTPTSGNRTLTPYGLATIICIGTNTFTISGPGLS